MHERKWENDPRKRTGALIIASGPDVVSNMEAMLLLTVATKEQGRIEGSVGIGTRFMAGTVHVPEHQKACILN